MLVLLKVIRKEMISQFIIVEKRTRKNNMRTGQLKRENVGGLLCWLFLDKFVLYVIYLY